MNTKVRPHVGVGVAVIHDGKILLGKRKGAHEAGTWSSPGGHLECGETPAECAARELFEETGLKALSVKESVWVNNILDNGTQYITIWCIVDQCEGSLELKEPHKCEGWQWFDLTALPEPLFPTDISFHEKMRTCQFGMVQSDPQLSQLVDHLDRMYAERDWKKFHSPKNLVMDVASEVGELVDPFRYLTEAESYAPDARTRESIRDEIGDVFKCIVNLSYALGIDPIEAAYQKIEKTRQKYPVALCKGNAQKYTAYQNTP